MTTKTAEELYAEADRHERDAADSFDRCDTDGFLSQWASGLSAQLARAKARLVEAGGLHGFSALFTTDGDWVPAKVIATRYGHRWMLLDEHGKATGEFLPYMPKRRDTLAKKGFIEGRVMRPAKAVIDGQGRGLSGTAWVAIRPTDRDWDPPVRVITADRWTG